MFNEDAFTFCGDTPQEVYLAVSQLTKYLMDKFNFKTRESNMAEFLYPEKPLFNYEAITAWVFDVITEHDDLNYLSLIPTIIELFSIEVKEQWDYEWGEALGVVQYK